MPLDLGCAALDGFGLLAQAAASGPEIVVQNRTSPVWTMTMGIAGVAVIIGVFLWFQAADMRHKERMRALELGRSLPPRRVSPFWTTGWLAAAFGLVLPVTALGFASMQGRGYSQDATAAWIAAGIIAGMGVVGATALTLRTASLAIEVARLDRQDGVLGSEPTKPGVQDPDAFDTASQRAAVEPRWSPARSAHGLG